MKEQHEKTLLFLSREAILSISLVRINIPIQNTIIIRMEDC